MRTHLYDDSVDYPTYLYMHFGLRDDSRLNKLLFLASRNYAFTIDDKFKIFTRLSKEMQENDTVTVFEKFKLHMYKKITSIKKRFVFSKLYRPYDYSDYKKISFTTYKKMHNLLYYKNLSNNKPKSIFAHTYGNKLSEIESYIAAKGGISPKLKRPAKYEYITRGFLSVIYIHKYVIILDYCHVQLAYKES